MTTNVIPVGSLVESTRPGEAPAIEFRSLHKDYGDRVALAGIDLAVERGQLFGFLGPNGAGKTTAIRTLLDLIRATSGQALALGLDSRRNSVEVRRRIGYLAGEAQFYPDLTANELFRYIERMRGGGVDPRYVERLIDDLQLDADRPIGSLSRGNRQKVGIVQALLAQPELIIMDEPTTGLDPLMQDVVETLLREVVADGRTVFFSSHVLTEVEQLCSRAAVLRAGEIVRVIDLVEERRIAPRQVRVQFASPVTSADFDNLAGVRVIEVADGHARFETNGSIDALVKALARHTVVELESSEPTLEDLFRSLYIAAGGDA